MNELLTDSFPLSKAKQINGNRRLAREKVMQVLMAHEISGVEWEAIFSHVFFREFNFDEVLNTSSEFNPMLKLLTPAEVTEIESDIPILWKDEEIEFGRILTKSTIELKSEIDDMIQNLVQNWELVRLALIDKILMYIAATEIMKFPEIPLKVSINEAIDIAKKYSTEKSGTFINGILDKILETLKADGKVHKTGRGLIEK